MKILFEDGSFIMFDLYSHDNSSLIEISMCGSYGNRTTLSTSKLTEAQVVKIIGFLSGCIENKK